MSQSQPANAERAIRLLLIVGIAVSLVAAVGGSIILASGSLQDSASQSVWKLGQYMVGMGLTNMFIYMCIFLQLRKAGSQGAPV